MIRRKCFQFSGIHPSFEDYSLTRNSSASLRHFYVTFPTLRHDKYEVYSLHKQQTPKIYWTIKISHIEDDINCGLVYDFSPPKAVQKNAKNGF